MNLKTLLKNKSHFLIAEIGNNHEGNFNTAVKLIVSAKKSGADAVKFQTFITEKFINPQEKKRYKKLKKFELSFEQFEKLSVIAKKNKLKFISTPFDLVSAEFLSKIVDVFKIASGDNNYFNLIDKVIKYNKPVLISLGLSDNKSVKKLYTHLKKIKNNLSNLAFLHCKSQYPVPDEDANLKSIIYLKKNFNLEIGYSDHTSGIFAPIIANHLGCKLIEKHFTLDNNFSSFRDHKVALNPKNMKNLSENLKLLPKMLGVEKIFINNEERKNIRLMRRSPYLNLDLKKNSLIKKENIDILRPFVGHAPEIENKLFNTKLKGFTKKYTKIKF